MCSRVVARAAALAAYCSDSVSSIATEGEGPIFFPLNAFRKPLSFGDYWHLPSN